MFDVRPEVSPHDAVPPEAAVLVELVLDVVGDLLLGFELLEGVDHYFIQFPLQALIGNRKSIQFTMKSSSMSEALMLIFKSIAGAAIL